jgi:hypothetical protein
MTAFVRALERAVGYALLLTLAVAPWAFGAQRPRELRLLSATLIAISGGWLVRRLISVSPPLFPSIPTTCVCLLLAHGWWMYANAHRSYQFGSGTVAPLLSVAPGLPGSVEKAVTFESMLLLTGILGTVLLVRDLPAQWTVRIAWTIAGSGSALIAVGLIERAGFISPFNGSMQPHEGRPFAAYNYHGNAGSFINIVIPAVLAWLFRSMELRRPLSISSYIALLAVCLAGVFVTASRAAMAVTPVVAIAFFVLMRRSTGRRREMLRPTVMLLTVPVVIAITLLWATWSVQPGWQRWNAIATQLSREGTRPILWSICWDMAKEAGCFGSGPGTFKMVFPSSHHMRPELYPKYIVIEHVPGQRVSMWSNAHHDLLQTIIEWGWFGTAVWGVLLFGGVAQSLWRDRCPMRVATDGVGDSSHPHRESLWSAMAIAALVGVLLHGLVDFPMQVPSLQLHIACCVGLTWRPPPRCTATAAAESPRSLDTRHPDALVTSARAPDSPAGGRSQ